MVLIVGPGRPIFGLGEGRWSAVAVTVPRRRLTRLAVSDPIRDLAGPQARDRAEMGVDGRMGSRRRRLGRLHGGRPARAGKHADAGHDLSATGGLAALSLDALSSVAYGPEAMVLVLIAAGTSALRFTVPLTLVITGMLVLLVISYTQVIAAHPDGGGAYAVAKTNLGRSWSLLAAASLFVDYVLTVAVSLAAGAASLGSVFPALADHLLLISLIGLLLLAAINMFGITESARLLMLPTAVFIISILAVIAVGPFHPRPVARIGSYLGPIKPVTTLGIVLILKAFASGCSAVTGVEAIANGVPAFRKPRVRTAQRTEIALGALLGFMLVGLAILIRAHHVVPRGGVTILAQVTAGAFGTGWPFYVSNLAVTAVLGFAANTSFGGLPVLMSLLARDHRLPHVFYLRAGRPVYRYGIVALAFAATLLLVAVNAQTNRLIPLFTIGVFIGFTISQVGLVRHWRQARPPRWRARAALNGVGAAMTAVAVVVFLTTKFLEGAWVVVIAVPLLMFLFSHTESYYAKVATGLRLGKTPGIPRRRESIVVVPTSTVNLLTELALTAALSFGETVVAVAVAGDEQEREQIIRDWGQWKCRVPLEVLVDSHRSLIRTVLRYIESIEAQDTAIMVLIPEIIPTKRRHEILHNQRGRLLETVLKARTNVVIATLPFHIDD
jgi:amino acid transporter